MNSLSFRELSALVSALTIGTVGVLYFPDALWLAADLSAGRVEGLTRRDFIGAGIGMVVLLIGVQIAGQVLLAVLFRSEANAPADERDALIQRKAIGWGYHVLGLAVVLIAGHLLWHEASGLSAALAFLAAFFAAEFVRYAATFIYYRRGA